MTSPGETAIYIHRDVIRGRHVYKALALKVLIWDFIKYRSSVIESDVELSSIQESRMDGSTAYTMCMFT